MRHMGYIRPPGFQLADLPLVKLDRRLWDTTLQTVGRKLMLALFYQTFRVPLARDGRIWLKTLSNAENLGAAWFQQVRDMAGLYVNPMRSARSLLDQLTIQWDFMTDPRVSIYLVTLQKTLVFIGLVTERSDLHDVPEGDWFGPFDWKARQAASEV